MIYAERDKVLRNEDLDRDRSGVRRATRSTRSSTAICRRERRRLGDGRAGGGAPHAMGLDGPGTTEDELWESAQPRRDTRPPPGAGRCAARGARQRGRRGRLGDRRTARPRADDRLAPGGAPHRVDDMRRGIGLRGYAQQDPLNEFRREAFQLYEELRALIRHQVATSIFRVTVTRHDRARTVPGRRRSGAAAAAASGPLGFPTAAAAPRGSRGGRRGRVRGQDPRARSDRGGAACRPYRGTAIRHARSEAISRGGGTPAGGSEARIHSTGARIGRNDPCWCGSGNKYKKCHGRLTEGAGDVRDPSCRRSCRRRSPGRSSSALSRYSASVTRAAVTRQRPADAIVVLGAAQYNGAPSPVFAARLDHADRPYHAGDGPDLRRDRWQGPGGDLTTEAAAVAYAFARDVPATAILVEERRPEHAPSNPDCRHDPRDRQQETCPVRLRPKPHARVLRWLGTRAWTANGSPTPTSPPKSTPPTGAGHDPRTRRARLDS